MERKVFRVLAILALAALAAQLPVPVQGRVQTGAPQHAGNRVSFNPVYDFTGNRVGPIIGDAYSQLVRSKNGVTMTFHTRGLEPGTVVTVWWVFFNNPEACFTSPCTVADLTTNPASQPSLLYAGGKVVGPNGTLNIGAHRAVGDTSGAEPIPPFPAVTLGLLDPMNAEVHLVIRAHGEALEGDQLIQQLTTFNGGCPPYPVGAVCRNLQASIHQP